MLYWISGHPPNAWWPRGRQPELQVWQETGEYARRQPLDELAPVRALKAQMRLYAERGGGWGGDAHNPFNALIFSEGEQGGRRKSSF